MNAERRYYRQRVTGEGAPRLTLEDIGRMTLATIQAFEERGCFQEAFGKWCPDNTGIKGRRGDGALFLFTHAHRRDLWPARETVYETLDELSLFTVIEVLHDCASEPREDGASFHDWSNCGWHYTKFNQPLGQTEWRKAINAFLPSYGQGFRLSNDGEVEAIGASGLRELMDDSFVRSPGNIDEAKVERAVKRFRHALSNQDDRKDALRDLADVLENHRTRIGELVGNRDEGALFNIANNFAIRHHNDRQKTEYGPEMQTWIFHTYLAMTHLVLGLGKREAPAAVAPAKRSDDDYASDDDIPF